MDPFKQVYDFWSLGNLPPLAWAVEWSRDGQIDPVTAAWNASEDPDSMLVVSGALRGRNDIELRPALAAVLDLGRFVQAQRSRQLIESIRMPDALVSQKDYANAFAPLIAANKNYTQALDSGLTAISSDGDSLYRWNFARSAFAQVQAAIGLAAERDQYSLVAGRAIADVIRAHLAPPTFPELSAAIERGSV